MSTPVDAPVVVGLSRPFPRLLALVCGDTGAGPSVRGRRLQFFDVDEQTDLAAVAARSEVLIVHGEAVDGSLLAGCPSLRLVIKCGVGLDSVDLRECAARGVRVRNCPDSVTASAAEFAIALLLCAARQIPSHSRLDIEQIDESAASDLIQLSGRRLGILGYGRIGRAVAAIAAAMGMAVIFHDPATPVAITDGPASSVSVEDLFVQADAISIHIPGGPGTRHLVGRPLLQRMRTGSLLVNTSRGSVLDQAALIEALDARLVRFAALDVLDEADHKGSEALRAHPRAIITPHMAGSTADSRDALADECYAHITDYVGAIRD